ncbi:MAG: nucleotide exchange factor GrpE [Candidatus Lokiarchaeota archaeon]|nr:nucleotide exchange factor GrpE [Candidatus Harpocratesius repetitus]
MTSESHPNTNSQEKIKKEGHIPSDKQDSNKTLETKNISNSDSKPGVISKQVPNSKTESKSKLEIDSQVESTSESKLQSESESNIEKKAKPNAGNSNYSKQKSKPKSEIDKLKEEIEKLKKQLKKKDQQIQNQLSKYRYLQAELENTRKHYIKQQDVVQLKTKVKTITAFTPLIDAFEKAFETAQKQKSNGNISPSNQMDNFMHGFQKLYDMLKRIFKSYHVEPIDKTGIPFDFNYHEVMMKVINDDLPEDTVINVIQKGYKIKDQVIQPAKVIVSKHSPPPAKKVESKEKETEKIDNEKDESNKSKSENGRTNKSQLEKDEINKKNSGFNGSNKSESKKE